MARSHHPNKNAGYSSASCPAERGKPDLLDRARAGNLGHGKTRFGRDADKRRDLPTLPQVPRGPAGRAVGGHAGLAFFAIEILRADRPGFGLRGAVKITEVQTEPIERRLSGLSEGP